METRLPAEVDTLTQAGPSNSLAGRQESNNVLTPTTNGQHDQSNNPSPVSTPKKYKQWDLSAPLPKLPVPDLQGTMGKYLNLIKTVVQPQDYAKTKYIVEDFLKPGGIGQDLQEYLLKKQQCTDNWSLDWWLNDMYLNVRLPVMVNSNPGVVFGYQGFPSHKEQIRFASKFIRGVLDFKHLLDTRTLPVERCKYKEKGQPLCMDQHYKLFSSYREPGRERDVQRSDLGFMGRDFFVVACNNQFYKVDLFNNGEELSESDLCLQLSRVQDMAEQNCNQSEPVGILTSQPRTLWAEARERLLQDAINRANLHVLENCLFILCLDKPTVPSRDSPFGGLFDDLTARTHHIIHGQGVQNNSANRWMDKTVQIIISEDGTCGVNMEHSVAEGIALIHMIEHAFNFMGKEKITETTLEVNKQSQPKCLLWNLTPQSLEDIELAKESVDSLVEDFDLTVFKFDSYGREFIKSQNLSPDAFIQLALQLTYYKIHGTVTSTYESASVRRYRQGRVDVIRANSPAALSWIKAMLGQTEATEEDKLHLLTEAIQWQQEYMLDTILGHGIDLHLLGLREAAKELGIPTPEFFKDPSYKELNTFRLSTSQVPTVSDIVTGYGAVVPDGYGCCYNPKPDHILFSVGAFHSCIDTSSEMFAHSLESSLLQMAELCRYDSNKVSMTRR